MTKPLVKLAQYGHYGDKDIFVDPDAVASVGESYFGDGRYGAQITLVTGEKIEINARPETVVRLLGRDKA